MSPHERMTVAGILAVLAVVSVLVVSVLLVVFSCSVSPQEKLYREARAALKQTGKEIAAGTASEAQRKAHTQLWAALNCARGYEQTAWEAACDDAEIKRLTEELECCPAEPEPSGAMTP